MRHFLHAAMMLLAAAPALAQDRPLLFPARDVAVTYRFTGAQAPAGLPGMTLSWLSAQQVMRMDMGPMGYMVADHRNQRGFMVVEAARMIMEIPMAQAMQQAGPSPSASYRRTGSDRVAGLACTLWSYQDGDNTGNACITTEGVMLRVAGSSGGQSGSMEATQVAFGAQDPTRFQRPQGFQSMQVPGQGGTAQPGQRPSR